MSLFSWIFPVSKARQPAPESSGLSRMEPTRPVRRDGRESSGDNAQPANRKGQRMARRELLYAVVRECMVKSGVLSSRFKFKVLSLDGAGRQFLVMVDLAADCGIASPQFGEIEALVAQSAKSRHDIIVTSVYWRTSEHVAVGNPKSQAARGTAEAAGAKPRARSVHDPIDDEEVEAFKKALAAGATKPATMAAAPVGVQPGPSEPARANYTLLTGFEDTEMASGHEHEETPAPVLSGTQYGELR